MQRAGRGSRLAGLYAKGSEKSGKPGRGPLASTVDGRGRHGEGGQRRQHCCRSASPWRCESMPRVAGCGAPLQGRTAGLVPRGGRRRVWSRKRKWSGRAPVVTTGCALRGGEDVVTLSQSHFCRRCSPRVVRMYCLRGTFYFLVKLRRGQCSEGTNTCARMDAFPKAFPLSGDGSCSR